MIVRSVFAVALALSVPIGTGAARPQPRHRGDQDAALEARKRGRIMPLRDIERRVVPSMRRAQYIGVDFDSGSAVYTLKFLRDGNIIWVSVDGRSGAIIGRTGG